MSQHCARFLYGSQHAAEACSVWMEMSTFSKTSHQSPSMVPAQQCTNTERMHHGESQRGMRHQRDRISVILHWGDQGRLS